jgi:hypothetical protein
MFLLFLNIFMNFFIYLNKGVGKPSSPDPEKKSTEGDISVPEWILSAVC